MCGSFDLTASWGVDTDIASDMATTFAMIARVHPYPDSLGYDSQFHAIVRSWRPGLADMHPDAAYFLDDLSVAGVTIEGETLLQEALTRGADWRARILEFATQDRKRRALTLKV